MAQLSGMSAGRGDLSNAITRYMAGSEQAVRECGLLGEVLGRELRFEAQGDAEARAEMSEAMPADYVDAFFNFYADGALDESAVRPAVADLTGRPPRAFAQWAAAHAAAFR